MFFLMVEERRSDAIDVSFILRLACFVDQFWIVFWMGSFVCSTLCYQLVPLLGVLFGCLGNDFDLFDILVWLLSNRSAWWL